MSQVPHRAGLLKQSNKGHKTHGGHRSKGALDRINRGKVGPKSGAGQVSSSRARGVRSKLERRNQVKQVRELKRAAVLDAKRALGGANFPPVLVAVLPLDDPVSETDLDELVDAIVGEAAQPLQDGRVPGRPAGADRSLRHVSSHRLKKRFCFVRPDPEDLLSVLDAAKVCDAVLFVASSSSGATSESRSSKIGGGGGDTIAAVLAQGIPALPTFLILDRAAKDNNSGGVRIRPELEARKKALLKWVQSCVCQGVDRCFSVTLGSDVPDANGVQVLLRHLGEQRRRPSSLRDNRAHLLVEEAEYLPDSGGGSTGTLKVSGYVRSGLNVRNGLDVNRLVHVPGWGDFQLDRIEAPGDPHPLVLLQQNRARGGRQDDVEMLAGGQGELLARPDPAIQEPLTFENEPDGMDGEQTWPTDEELMEAAAELAEKASVNKRVVKVPKGTGEYQAAWIVDDEDDDADDDDEDGDEDVDDEGEDHGNGFDMDDEDDDDDDGGGQGDEVEEYETVTVTDGVEGDAEAYDDKNVDLAEEQEALKKLKAARMDAMFPDEVDTPVEQLAKIRFQKYRGLSSFRTSPWDPKENLPYDYARIFQFENFQRTKNRVMADLRKKAKMADDDQDEEGCMVKVGSYVSLYIRNVPEHLYAAWRARRDKGRHDVPLVVYSILPHEQKMSVVNVVVKGHRHISGGDLRRPSSAVVVKAKERLVFHVGYRRFAACPVFSQHTNGDKHKYVRFWEASEAAVVVMTFFAPIMFPPANVLVFRESATSSARSLVGTGTLLSADPDRLVVKRAVLSGHPFKVHRKSAVVRFMFFNRTDIEWFKPVELRTKRGRRGHIKEPLGTHGHMKVVFDGPVSQQDTVLMNLYKRVYPKWTYDPSILPDEDDDRTSTSLRNQSDAFTAPETLQLGVVRKASASSSAQSGVVEAME